MSRSESEFCPVQILTAEVDCRIPHQLPQYVTWVPMVSRRIWFLWRVMFAKGINGSYIFSVKRSYKPQDELLDCLD
ncbi:hypothetical protein NPIL_344321 [Nephila pilipes]|uniref:Uncharacterized protein n=1 Tax=Nephila pilipes TaxID=299642 RepID=A0A8X6N4A6_NEPPI|nr:hypothetical protein NPIL_344321 [Nephila pilipes]